jgi:hypothetical protein
VQNLCVLPHAPHRTVSSAPADVHGSFFGSGVGAAGGVAFPVPVVASTGDPPASVSLARSPSAASFPLQATTRRAAIATDANEVPSTIRPGRIVRDTLDVGFSPLAWRTYPHRPSPTLSLVDCERACVAR